MSIPKIIYQTCADKSALPPEIAAGIKAIQAANPSWNYRLYDDQDIFKFIKDHYGESIHRSARRIHPAYGVVLADLFRYLAIYKTGGVYLDVKSTLEHPLDQLFRPDDAFLLSQWRNKFGEEFMGWGLHDDLKNFPGGEFQQWHVIAASRHPFLEAVIKRVLRNIDQYDAALHGVGKLGVLRLSGPICYTLAILPKLRQFPYRIVDIYRLGFRYSIFRDYRSPTHPRNSSAHYSKQTAPILLPPQST